MTRKVLILDTSVVCCWLKVPSKEVAGPLHDRWDFDRISKLIDREVEGGSTLVLPLAAFIETGNHIAQAAMNRYACAVDLAEKILSTANAVSPWALFSEQNSLWEADNLQVVCRDWPALAAGGTTIGDMTIKDVAEYYARAGFLVEIVTGDEGLKSYEPRRPILVPRRRGG